MRCKTCHYSLANLKEHRCPECGTPFDPNDPRTFLSGGPQLLLPIGQIAVALFVAGLVFLIMIEHEPFRSVFLRPNDPHGVRYLAAVAVLGIGALSIVTLLRFLRR